MKVLAAEGADQGFSKTSVQNRMNIDISSQTFLPPLKAKSKIMLIFHGMVKTGATQLNCILMEKFIRSGFNWIKD